MDDQTKERWFQLCQLAAVEYDSQKLLALVEEINRLLEQKQARLDSSRRGEKRTSSMTAESDAHQNEARQPYRSREVDSADGFAEGVHLPGTTKKRSDKKSD